MNTVRVLTFLKYCKNNEVPLDIGAPLDFQGSLGGVQVSICLDTGAGGNAVSSSLIKNLHLEILQAKTLEQPLYMEVGNSEKTKVTRILLLNLKTRNHEAPVWVLECPNLPITALIGKPTASRLGITLDTKSDQAIWENELLPKGNIPAGMYFHRIEDTVVNGAPPIKMKYSTQCIFLPEVFIR